MARYILIDNCSGYIWGDSADLDGKIFTGTPLEFAAALDQSIYGNGKREYEEVSRLEFSNTTGYHVYRADVDGSEAVPIVRDGQDREMIRAVQASCEPLGCIRVTDAADIFTANSKRFGEVEFDGARYALTEQADLTSRLFAGGFQDASEGDEYWTEYGARAINEAGDDFYVTWHFLETKGAEEEDASNYDWSKVERVTAR